MRNFLLAFGALLFALLPLTAAAMVDAPTSAEFVEVLADTDATDVAVDEAIHYPIAEGVAPTFIGLSDNYQLQ